MKKDLELSIGKIPPQNLEAEEAVLGAMLISQNDLLAPINLLNAEMFYMPSHRLIFEAIKQLFAQRSPVDLLTTTDTLRKMGKLDEVGGSGFLYNLTEKVSSSANLEFHAGIITERYLKRKLIEMSNIAIASAYDQTFDVFEIIDQLQTEILSLTNKIASNKPKTLKTDCARCYTSNRGKYGSNWINRHGHRSRKPK